MGSFFTLLLTFILLCASIFLVLVILMQRPSANAGMGAALGGGAAESAFGGDTAKVLSRWTVGGIITFFIVAFALSMVQIHGNSSRSQQSDINLEKIVDGDGFPEK
ncbi:MAG: preprotein translocase subunit SecG [Puniceicoccales bacterium]|jgi:preprotein translocase subunit SecG|nr:preprotein translocase subunit SecG [Puniceicoccales bacterium]